MPNVQFLAVALDQPRRSGFFGHGCESSRWQCSQQLLALSTLLPLKKTLPRPTHAPQDLPPGLVDYPLSESALQRPLVPLEDGSLLVKSLTRAIGAGMLYFDDPERLRSTTRRAAPGCCCSCTKPQASLQPVTARRAAAPQVPRVNPPWPFRCLGLAQG